MPPDIGRVFTCHQEVETIVMFWTSFIIIVFLNYPISKISRILLSETFTAIESKINMQAKLIIAAIKHPVASSKPTVLNKTNPRMTKDDCQGATNPT